MRRSRIAVAAATATALVGSIAAITPSPQAEASSNRPRSVAQAAIATDGKGIINKDCRDAVINDAKLRAAIAGALVKAGFSSADAVALAPRIAREMAKEGVLLINHHKLKALIGAQVGLLTDAKIQRAAAAVDLGIKATLAATIIPNALHSAAFKDAVVANLVAAGVDKKLAKATAVAIAATALNPALGPIAKTEAIKAEIAAQAALLVSRGVHLKKAAIDKPGQALAFRVLRDGTEIVTTLIPEAKIVKDIEGKSIEIGLLGIGMAGEMIKEKHGIFGAFKRACEETNRLIYLIAVSIKKMITGSIPADSIGGPILIFQIYGEQTEQGFNELIRLTALLSINLGLLNLLPIPVLDGGHIFFFLIELLKGKPISERSRERAQQVGLFMLLSLMVFAFYNDIVRIIT